MNSNFAVPKSVWFSLQLWLKLLKLSLFSLIIDICCDNECDLQWLLSSMLFIESFFSDPLFLKFDGGLRKLVFFSAKLSKLFPLLLWKLDPLIFLLFLKTILNKNLNKNSLHFAFLLTIYKGALIMSVLFLQKSVVLAELWVFNHCDLAGVFLFYQRNIVNYW